MPPEPNLSENVEPAELYEPENPTEENDDEDDDGDGEVEKSTNENITATKDDGDDYGNDDDGDDDDDKNKKSKKDLDKKLTDSDKYDPEDDNASQTSSKIDKTTDAKDTNDDKLDSNTVRSPSPATSEVRLPESETAAANRKGVLELYDDSDWEELDIDRPKDSDKKNTEKDKNTAKNGEEKADEENENEPEQDRSYTPCLDENNDPEEPETEAATVGAEENSEAVSSANKNSKSSTTKNNKKDDKNPTAENIQDMDTELISEEEDDIVRNSKDRKKSQKGNNDKRGSDRRGGDKVETFKKIGNKQKIRNYRGDQKQPGPKNRRTDKRRRSRSPVSRSRSRSRSAASFRSRGGRSRSRSPRFRGRGGRSRSRSNNKENQGRWAGNQRDGGRFNRNSQLNQQNNRLKRRELPRYDVRNVVGHHSSPSKVVAKDRYGRDTSRNRRNSRSLSRGRRGRSPPPHGRSPVSRSRSRSRNRRLSISLSPSPAYSRRRSMSPPHPPRRYSPVRRRSASDGRRTPPFRQQRSSRSPLRVMRSRSLSPVAEHRMNGRKVTRHLRGGSQPRNLNRGQRSRSLSLSPRYTPRISRSRSKSPRPKGGKKKKAKESRKKKSKRRMATISPSPNRRISRQPDPFDIEKPPKKKRRRSPRAKSPLLEDHGWSPSPSPPPTQAIADNFDYPPDKNVSWTPPMQSPLLGLFRSGDVRSVSRSSRKDKNKRGKKKKKGEKRRDGRKDKKRKRRTETPEPAPSKEVFASGNNILVSVSFNKETTLSQQHAQQTIVTLPQNREDLMSLNRRTSVDRATIGSNATKRRKDKRKKIDTKPVAIIDLERSPFQVEQEPTDVIVLTDSEEANERDQQREHRRDRHRSESSCPRDTDAENTSHRNQRSGGASGGQRGDKSTPERLDTIHEESYDLTQTGPKTPPEPPLVKFNLQAKKQSKVRNPLHEDEDDMASDGELDERQQQQLQENHRSDMDTMHAQSSQKIGPNTPPESGPCSPDAYDPFEPTKSPSISPRSPTPPPSQMDVSQNSICGESNGDLIATQKHIENEQQQQRREQIPGLGGNVAQGASINPVDLVMALINSKSVSNNNNQDLTNKSNDSQHLNSNDDSFRDKGNDEGNSITVLSNLLISSGNMQHIPSISSPTPPSAMSKKLPALPKIGGSVGGSSSSGVNMRNGGTVAGTSNNADDSFNMNDIESPYSPGSAEYDDLFEPPPEASGGNKRRSKRGKPAEVFDNLFGSSSPVGNVRLPSYTPSKKHKGGVGAGATRKSKVKGGFSKIMINSDVFWVIEV